MTKKIFYILGILFCLNSCNSSRQTAKSSAEINLEQIKYVMNKSGFIQLPLNIASNYENAMNISYQVDQNSKDSLIFDSDIYEIVGALPDTNNYYAFLFPTVGDMLYPTIITFDKEGNKIDRQIISVSCCAGAGPIDEISCYDSLLMTQELKIISKCKLIGTIETDDSVPQILNICNERYSEGYINNKGKIILRESKLKDCN